MSCVDKISVGKLCQKCTANMKLLSRNVKKKQGPLLPKLLYIMPAMNFVFNAKRWMLNKERHIRNTEHLTLS